MNRIGSEGDGPVDNRHAPSAAGEFAGGGPVAGSSLVLDLAGQRFAGLILAMISVSGILLLGAWLHPDPYRGLAHSMGRAATQSVYVALIALFLWTLLRRSRRGIAYLLVFGILLSGVVSYHGIAAYQANRQRVAANEILVALREGWREAGDLTEPERANPYVDAFLGMRELYWDLHSRAEERMAPYRRLYEKYTRRGGFLDTGRLGSTYDLWYSYFQVHELRDRLDRAAASEIRISDLLWTVSLLEVDAATRADYAADLRTAADAIGEAQAASIAGERAMLDQIKWSLEVLIEANGHFRVDGSRIVFDRPEDAARFAGKPDGRTVE